MLFGGDKEKMLADLLVLVILVVVLLDGRLGSYWIVMRSNV
jgi:hypothetical protein